MLYLKISNIFLKNGLIVKYKNTNAKQTQNSIKILIGSIIPYSVNGPITIPQRNIWTVQFEEVIRPWCALIKWCFDRQVNFLLSNLFLLVWSFYRISFYDTIVVLIFENLCWKKINVEYDYPYMKRMDSLYCLTCPLETTCLICKQLTLLGLSMFVRSRKFNHVPSLDNLQRNKLQRTLKFHVNDWNQFGISRKSIKVAQSAKWAHL